ncbi:MAG: DUF1826 domain-containing protein [Pseudomonadota bacterium]
MINFGGHSANTDNVTPITIKQRIPVFGDDASVLANVYEQNVGLAVWHRKISSELQSAVDEALTKATPPNIAIALAPDDALGAVAEMLSTDKDNALCRDVAELVEMFSYLFDAKRIGLRLAALDRAMCPRFHVDRIQCRMVTTYHGLATEWLQHRSVDRSHLGVGRPDRCDRSAGLYQSEDDIQTLACGQVAILKGEEWPQNEGAGLVHRSPAVRNGERRLFLSLDIAT